MCNGYTHRQICLMNQLRKLWGQHVYWTRFFIISTAEGLADLKPVTDRLLENPEDFAKLLAPVYGAKTACRFKELLTEHLQIGGELVGAAKNGETGRAGSLRGQWYRNADEIAAFLASVNRCWQESKWKDMLHSHLKMTEKEAELRLKGNYAADIQIFGSIEEEAFKMADYMFCGIVKQGVCF